MTAGGYPPRTIAAVQRLSGLDASFLYLETSSQLLHVCGLIVIDPSTVPGGYSYDTLRDSLASRIHLVPAFRQKLRTVPFGLDHPVWIDDPDFDLDHHLHHIAVPAPGGREEVARLVADIAGQQLDRSKPLWEMWVIEGLDDGNVAVVSKVHHATVDGVTGANLLANLCTLEPDATPPETDRWDPASPPGDLEMAVRALPALARRPATLLKVLPATVGVVPAWVSRRRGGTGMRSPFTAPRTPFNGTLTGHREVAFARESLDDVKTVKNAFGTTVNDVVMAMCAGALRRYLIDHEELPPDPLVAMVPVSVHERSDRDIGTNKVSGMFTELATHLDDPIERLMAMAAGNRSAKEHQQAIPADLLQDWANFAAPRTFGLAVRAYSSLRLAERHPVVHNLVISNVPGPPFPLYFLGARIIGLHPLGPVFHGAGLNLTVLSNDGHLDIGLLACREHVPDVWSLVDDMSAALGELVEAAGTR